MSATVAEEKEDTRDLNDRERLKEEARTQVAKHAAELRAATVPIETEPSAAYEP
jgi:hypothetical protein